MENWIIKHSKYYFSIDEKLIEEPKSHANLFKFIKNIWINSPYDFSLNLQKAGLQRTKKRKCKWLFVLKQKRDMLEIEVYFNGNPYELVEIKK